MKVILTKNVEKFGQAGEIKEVSNGYARNFLIPRKLAVKATPKAVRSAKNEAENLSKQQHKQARDLQSLAEKIKGQKISFKAKADARGKLFGSVTADVISREIEKKFGQKLDPQLIELSEPVKLTGEYEIPLALDGNDVIINLEIKPEKQK